MAELVCNLNIHAINFTKAHEEAKKAYHKDITEKINEIEDLRLQIAAINNDHKPGDVGELLLQMNAQTKATNAQVQTLQEQLKTEREKFAELQQQTKVMSEIHEMKMLKYKDKLRKANEEKVVIICYYSLI